jgi:hypothetical protein
MNDYTKLFGRLAVIIEQSHVVMPNLNVVKEWNLNTFPSKGISESPWYQPPRYLHNNNEQVRMLYKFYLVNKSYTCK